MLRTQAREDPELFLRTYETPIIIDEFQYAPELLSYIKIKVDNDVINSLACLPCAFCEEYFLVCCPSFPCFIHITLHHPYHEQVFILIL